MASEYFRIDSYHRKITDEREIQEVVAPFSFKIIRRLPYFSLFLVHFIPRARFQFRMLNHYPACLAGAAELLAGNRYEYPSGTDASDSMHLSMTVLDARSKLVQAT